MTPLVFLDTETTGLSLDDDIWEFAAIRREPDRASTELHLFLRHDIRKCARLPESFLADHQARFPVSIGCGWHPATLSQAEASRRIAEFTAGAHVAGAVPSFDTERLALLLRRYGWEPEWHYHLIDVEILAVGYLSGLEGEALMPPWESDFLSRACGVEPPSDEDRHTALGDARWAMRLYDKVVGVEA